MRRALVLALSTHLLACESLQGISLPNTAYESFVIVTSAQNGLEAFAGDKMTTSLEVVISQEGGTTTLIYDRPLAWLGLQPGRIPPATREPSRRLPKTSEAYVAVTDDDVLHWEPASVIPDAVIGFHFDGVSPESCLEVGGCFDQVEDWAGIATCLFPCPVALTIDPPAPVRPPQTPLLPMFLPCPLGWETSRDVDGAFDGCEPPIISRDRNCASDEAWLSGAVGCGRLGSPCPATEFAEDLPNDGSIVFVSATAGPNGMGTRASPVATIAEALQVADQTASATVALGRGVFFEEAQLTRPIFLIGACVRDTILRNVIGGNTVLNVRAIDVRIRNLTVDSSTIAVVVQNGNSVRIRDARVEGPIAIYADFEAEVSAERVRIVGHEQNTVMIGSKAELFVDQSVIEGGRLGLLVFDAHAEIKRTGWRSMFAGIAVVQGGDLVVEDILLENVEEEALALDSSTATMTGVHVARAAIGLVVRAGARLTAKRLVFIDVDLRPIVVNGGSAHAEDLYVRNQSSSTGHGLIIAEGSSFEAARLRMIDTMGVHVSNADAKLTDFAFERSTRTGPAVMALSASASTVAIERAFLIGELPRIQISTGDLTLRDLTSVTTEPHSFDATGTLNVFGSVAHLERVDFRECSRICLNAFASSLDVFDARLSPVSTTTVGYGFELQGGRLTGARFAIDGVGAALVIKGSESQLEDVSIVRRGPSAIGVPCVYLIDDTKLEMERLKVDGGGTSTGLIVESGGRVDLRDGLLERTSSAGIIVQFRSELKASRLRIVDTVGRGMTLNAGTAALAHLSIIGTTPLTNVPSDGNAIVLIDSAELMLSHFELRRSTGAALDVRAPSLLLISDGEIAENKTGVRATIADFGELRNIFQRTRFIENAFFFERR